MYKVRSFRLMASLIFCRENPHGKGGDRPGQGKEGGREGEEKSDSQTHPQSFSLFLIWALFWLSACLCHVI